MGLVIARETVEQVRPEIAPLIAAHWNEVGQDKVRMRLDPDWDGYRALEDAGQLLVATLRDDGILVGYAVFLVRRHLHYRTVRVAINDLLFILPGRREGLAGARLIRESEALLAAAGVQKIYFSVKVWRDYGPLLARRGYDMMETVWAKWLDGAEGEG